MKKSPTKKSRPKKKPVPRPLFYKTTTLPLLPGYFALCVADKAREAADFVARKHIKERVIISDEQAGVFRNESGGRLAFICGRKDLCHEVISHEIRHAADRFLWYAGVKLMHDNGETGAYLSGWLARWIYKQLHKAGETVKLA